MSGCYKLDIEFHDPQKCEMGKKWVQAKMLVHGYDDVMWTDNPEDALAFVKETIEYYLNQNK